jgi:hypothetical protein
MEATAEDFEKAAEQIAQWSTKLAASLARAGITMELYHWRQAIVEMQARVNAMQRHLAVIDDAVTVLGLANDALAAGKHK